MSPILNLKKRKPVILQNCNIEATEVSGFTVPGGVGEMGG
jgi:hypothetical protein